MISRFQDYFPQNTQNINEYTDSHITSQNTIKCFSNTAKYRQYIDDRTNIISIAYKIGSNLSNDIEKYFTGVSYAFKIRDISVF